ncbi:hypothetical protein [Pseudarthrobacter sp. NamB4]|uniref:hypothetical protein n=1 Tax=Pseudarthrobacter sp. NamB4 TaxID=2576837 RepID=UPI0010FE437A|nr:hypothetical protein [Pseudarthrobacter sp. NamB4]TLM75971.1 hypothetical protein FDW81_01055 [Pseudarthrobacter sp. NamB4]
MSTTFTMSDVARHFGISRSQAFRELPSWPHQRQGLNISFTASDMAGINRIMNAGPDEQLARLNLLEQKRAEVRAMDAV